jgi:hypothetical protein
VGSQLGNSRKYIGSLTRRQPGSEIGGGGIADSAAGSEVGGMPDSTDRLYHSVRVAPFVDPRSDSRSM